MTTRVLFLACSCRYSRQEYTRAQLAGSLQFRIVFTGVHAGMTASGPVIQAIGNQPIASGRVVPLPVTVNATAR